MKRHLQCAEQQESPSNLTKYCGCHETWLSWLILVTHEMSSTMRGATGVTLQHHQILPRPRKMILMIDHDWSASHMKRHLHYAGQQESPSNITKYCPGHEKWFSWLIMIDPRRIWKGIYIARSNSIYQIFCLPRKMTFQNMRQICWKRLKPHLQSAADPRMIRAWSENERVSPQPAAQLRTTRILYRKIQHFALRLSFQISPNTAPARKSASWISPNTAPATNNVQYNARSNRSHPPTSPNIAPATKSDSHDWSSSHMKCPVQCPEQQESPSNITKYCPGHEKWLSWLIMIYPRHIYETSFTLRGATGVTLQHHQILRPPWLILFTYETSSTLSGATGVIFHLRQILSVPRKVTLMIHPRHIWNVIYNARSNRCHCPKSPNTAPGTKNGSPKSQRNLPKTVETWFAAWGRSDHDPTMNLSVRNPARNRGCCSCSARAFSFFKNTTFCAPAISPNFTKYFKFHEILPLQASDTWTSPNTACATKTVSWISPNSAPATKSDSCNRTKFCTCHGMWQLNLPNSAPLWFYCSFSLLCFDPIILLLYSSLTLLFIDSSILWLCYSLALLFLDSTILWLYYSLILLFLDSTNLWNYYSWTLLIFDSTILRRYYSLTLLFFESAFLWLYYSLTPLIFDPTLLCLYYSLTLPFFGSAILWLYFILTLLLLGSNILWLYYSFTLLIFDSTILWLY